MTEKELKDLLKWSDKKVRQEQEREKLIGLVVNAHTEDSTSKNTLEHLAFIADHLIDNGVTIQKWIPLSEKLPEAGKTVLCLTKEFGQWVATWDNCGDEMWSDGEHWSSKCGVTHWMPLPELPREE